MSAVFIVAMWSTPFHGEDFPWPQIDRKGFSSAVLAMVNERTHRREPEPTLIGRLGAVPVRVRGHQGGVEVDDHLPAITVARDTGRRSMPCPYRSPGSRPDLPNGGDCLLDVGGQGRKHP